MLASYFKVALRNLLRHRLFTIINMIGLALGVACCLLIELYVQYELSFDRFHRDAGNVFRVLTENKEERSTSLNSITPRSLSTAIAREIPEVESATQFSSSTIAVGYAEKEYDANIVFAESSFFDVFTFSSIHNDLAEAIAEPNAAILTESLARKMFGDEQPIGKILHVNLRSGNTPPSEVKVAALMRNVPKNSLFDFEIVLPLAMRRRPSARTETINWNMFDTKTYIRFKNNTDIPSIEQKLPGFVQRTGGDSKKYRLALQRLTDIHLAPELPFDDVKPVNIRDLYTFAGIAILVLVIVCINYVVLATARYTQRLKEVGVRKVIGAQFGNLMLQFLIETALIASLSLPLALGIVEAAYRSFGDLLGKSLQVNYTDNNYLFLLGSVAGLVFFTLVAGSYPAFFFSKVKAITMLKDHRAGVQPSRMLRKGSVIVQFSIAIALFVCIGIMYEQLRFTRTKDLGYQHENLLVVHVEALGNDSRILKQAALEHSAVKAATLTSWLPGFLTSASSMPNPNGEGIIETEFLDADCDLLKTFHIQLLEGRGFDCSAQRDTMNVYASGRVDFNLLPKVSILMNQTAVKELGLISPVGRELKYASLQGTVIGVIRDMHNRSLHYPIKPMVIQYGNSGTHLVVAYQAGRESDVVQHLRRSWDKLTTKNEFEYFSLDDHLRKLYETDEHFMAMTGWFAGLAIALSCLGLFGLAVFSTERRIKEIGIRKVLGASAADVVALLSKDFVMLVVLANLVAWPAAYFAMDTWLQDFVYRVGINVMTFIVAGAVALLIAFLTVSAQSLKAAVANPVDSLRYE